MTRRYAPLLLAALVSALSLGSGLAQDAGTPTPDLTTDLFDPAVVEATPISGVETFTVESAAHTEDPVTYPRNPPAGGPHAPAWQKCEAYDAPIRNENAVHSLEHGAVWVTYTADISKSDKQKLENWAKDRPYLIVSEYDDQETPFVFTAWNNQLPLDSLDDKRATQFMNYFIQGAQTPERGASCTGVDTMLG